MIANKKPLILIVDDTPQNIQVLSKILYDTGYNISTSESGTHALQSISLQIPDLILLDVQMPGMNGFEVCQLLKANPDFKEIPVIFLTASSEPENILYGFKVGAVDYITKPFNIGELTVRVATHIELKTTKDKLIELNATKDKFFSIIAHDLINPSHQLLGLSDMLKKNIKRFDMTKIEQYADNINIAAEQNYLLLENLLNWGRSQLNKIDSKKEQFNLYDKINEVLSGLQSISGEKNIEIIIQGDETSSGLFNIEMFKAIVRNFITNAIKFSYRGDKIYCDIIDLNENYYKIAVKDSGVGIHKDDISKLFKLDVSHSSHGTNDEIGTGLGLILCKDFTDKNDSEIYIESEEGKGSIFSFTVKK